MCGNMQLNIYQVHYINIRVHSATVIRVVMLVNLEHFKEGQIITKNIQAKNKGHMPGQITETTTKYLLSSS